MNDETTGHTPPRALPPELRARLRSEFDRGMDGKGPRRSFRVPVVTAAAVVLLAGTIFVLRQVPNTAGEVAIGGPPVDQAVATAALDRCWAAVQQQGLTDRFPDRSRWTPSLTAGDSQVRVVAARADGKPLFCQTTATTATVTDPNAAPGSGTGAVLFSREGVVAGVTDVDWDRIALKGVGPHGSVALSTESGDRMFIARTGVNLSGITLAINEIGSENPTAVRVLTAPAPPAVLVRDRPDGPAPDRASDVGRALGDCLSRSSRPLPDQDSYQPGASVAYPGGLYVLGRGTGDLVACRTEEGKTEAVRHLLVNSSAPAVLKITDHVGGDRVIVGGELGADVATMEIGSDDDPPQPASVANRTFAFLVPVILPRAPRNDRRTVDLHAIARDADGTVLFKKTWNLF